MRFAGRQPVIGQNGVAERQHDPLAIAFEWFRAVLQLTGGERQQAALRDVDGDGADNATDCRPLDGTVFAAPVDVTGVLVQNFGAAQISWDLQGGSGTVFDIATGIVADLRTPAGFRPGTCLVSAAQGPADFDTRPEPAPGVTYYYMIRGRNTCGMGSYGSPDRDTHGSTGAPCP